MGLQDDDARAAAGQRVDLGLGHRREIGQHAHTTRRRDGRKLGRRQAHDADEPPGDAHETALHEPLPGEIREGRLAAVVEVRRDELRVLHRLHEAAEGRGAEIEFVVADRERVVAQQRHREAVVEGRALLLRGLERRARQEVVARVEQEDPAAERFARVEGPEERIEAQVVDLAMESRDAAVARIGHTVAVGIAQGREQARFAVVVVEDRQREVGQRGARTTVRARGGGEGDDREERSQQQRGRSERRLHIGSSSRSESRSPDGNGLRWFDRSSRSSGPPARTTDHLDRIIHGWRRRHAPMDS
ncbi:MAG: hypothetical protein R3F21_21485 [Myxococcota bacterium]